MERRKLLSNSNKSILQDSQINIFKGTSKPNLELAENFISLTSLLISIGRMKITVG